MNAAPPNDLLWLLFCIAIIMVGFFYWIPSFVAFARSHPHRWLILAANFIFAGTIVGWVVTLAWALTDVAKPKN